MTRLKFQRRWPLIQSGIHGDGLTVTEQQKIGRYEIADSIGRGMQGSVYQARDPELDRLVAIKILHPGTPGTDLVGNEDTELKTPLEARISSKLRHPNIVSIYDFGHHEGRQYLVFEYVEGDTLRQLLGANGMLSIEQVCRFAVPIAEAIAYAHGQGVVHLDLSPRNILVDATQNPRIMDFGLSQFSHNYVQQGDEIKGTPLYMAPEYFSGAPLGPYTDIYALGASFYQLVCGEPVVSGSSIPELASKIEKGAIDYSRIPKGEHSEGFTALLRACLEKDYRKRLQNGSQLRQLLQRFLSQNPVDVQTPGSEIHSTVQFLLRRMQRKKDFPSISRVLTDINRLTDDGDTSSTEKLANVILRDYALTNKLLKLVNSAFFSGVGGGEVTSVSKAVVLLGFKKIRSVANSLAYFRGVQGSPDNVRLRDSMIRSFLSGLLTRHLVQRAKRGDPEEGFICGLFQNLGENLAAYYFPDDLDEILAMTRTGQDDKSSASRRVLGVSMADLGVEVAKIWGLPDSIIAAIRGVEGPLDEAVESGDEFLRNRAVFANELCAVVEITDRAQQDQALDQLAARFGNQLDIDKAFMCRLFAAGMEKLSENAEILEFDYQASPYCRSAGAWLERIYPREDKAAAAGS